MLLASVEKRVPLKNLLGRDLALEELERARAMCLYDYDLREYLLAWNSNKCIVCGQSTYIVVRPFREDIWFFYCTSCKMFWPCNIFVCYNCMVYDPENIESYATEDLTMEIVFHRACKKYVKVLNLELDPGTGIREIIDRLRVLIERSSVLDEYAEKLGLTRLA